MISNNKNKKDDKADNFAQGLNTAAKVMDEILTDMKSTISKCINVKNPTHNSIKCLAKISQHEIQNEIVKPRQLIHNRSMDFLLMSGLVKSQSEQTLVSLPTIHSQDNDVVPYPKSFDIIDTDNSKIKKKSHKLDDKLSLKEKSNELKSIHAIGAVKKTNEEKEKAQNNNESTALEIKQLKIEQISNNFGIGSDIKENKDKINQQTIEEYNSKTNCIKPNVGSKDTYDKLKQSNNKAEVPLNNNEKQKIKHGTDSKKSTEINKKNVANPRLVTSTQKKQLNTGLKNVKQTKSKLVDTKTFPKSISSSLKSAIKVRTSHNQIRNKNKNQAYKNKISNDTNRSNSRNGSVKKTNNNNAKITNLKQSNKSLNIKANSSKKQINNNNNKNITHNNFKYTHIRTTTDSTLKARSRSNSAVKSISNHEKFINNLNINNVKQRSSSAKTTTQALTNHVQSNQIKNNALHYKLGGSILQRSAVLSRSAVESKKSSGNLRRRMAGGHSDPIQDFINLVNKAKIDKKIFTVCGNFFSVRRSLVERGWLEKVRSFVSNTKDNWKQFVNLPNSELFEGMKDKENGEKYRKAFIYKLLCRHQVDFYWDYMTNPFSVCSDKVKRTLINRYPPGSNRVYGSKAGLCESLQESHWYCIDGTSHVRYPRTYNLGLECDIRAFTDDFRLTACSSLLKWIIKTAENPIDPIMSSAGKIPIAVYNFALLQCQNYLRSKQHKDIDESFSLPKENDWTVFLDKFYKIVHNLNHFKQSNKVTKQQMIDQSRHILKRMERYWPNMNMDGYMNLWLLKPHNGSQGYGILICRTIKYILDTIKTAKDKKYVIQKYIERPLLIHKTKFDIRQFFLLCHQPSLQLWMYKECYLRFSSQIFSLQKLHESIHLTNNSIQCRYKSTESRNPALPSHNMWHCETFKQYLRDIGQPNVYDNVVYKGMKEAMTGLIMCCADKIIARINSFELCGVDFMLTENFQPYIIEINTRPALYNSTPVTAKMCPAVLEDVVKVTVDYARNPRASTGKFELIFKERHAPKTSYDKFALLSVNGVNCFNKKSVFDTLEHKPQKNFENGIIKNVLNIDADQIRRDVKTTLEKILSIIHVEREKQVTDKKEDQTHNHTFKNMLSEFVNIISTGPDESSKKTGSASTTPRTNEH